jgi:nucleoside-diphosphate-sugar epimerase
MEKVMNDGAISTQQTVLVVGGTGRTGQRLLEQLLKRGIRVRAIVRSSAKLSANFTANPNLTLIEADLLALNDAELQRHLSGCTAVISCLGHVISFKGVMGPPHDLVTRATVNLCRAIEALHPAAPVKFILMSSVSVHRPGGLDTRRGAFERAFMWTMRGVLPPARDNQRASDFLLANVGPGNPFVQWTVVRPDTLQDGDVSPYTMHEGLVNSLFAPGATNMANVAHFMCDLVTNQTIWAAWKGRLPVIVNETLINVAGPNVTQSKIN